MRTILALTLALGLAACADDPDAPAPSAAADAAVAGVDDVVPVDDAMTEPAPPFNLNTTAEADFAAIPEVGERMAHEFVEYRPYASIREFRRQIGKYVDDEQVAAYEPFVFVPVDANASDAETLAQLPGLSVEEAQALVDGRPYASDDAFRAAYEAAASAPDWATATVFLAE